MLCCDWSAPSRQLIGRSRASLGSPRVSAQSVCGTARGGGTGYTQQQASGIFHNGRHLQKHINPLYSPNNTLWTYWNIRVLLLDVLFFEVVCGQQLVPTDEGFPASERTERRGAPRDHHRGFKGLSRGKEEEVCENTNGDGHFPPLSLRGGDYK